MPEQSGTGTTTTTEEQGQAGTGTTTSEGGAGGSGSGQQQQSATQDKKLAAEAASWRTKFREAEGKIGTLSQQITDLEAKIGTGSPAANDQASAEIATLKRTVSDLQTKQKAAEERATEVEKRARTKTIQATLSGIAAEGKFTDAAGARMILQQYASVDDDGVVVFTVKDKDGTEVKVPATPESVREHKLLSDIFFPADGVAGSGSRGGARSAGANGLDTERWKTDAEYFEKNKDKVKEYLRGGR